MATWILIGGLFFGFLTELYYHHYYRRLFLECLNNYRDLSLMRVTHIAKPEVDRCILFTKEEAVRKEASKDLLPDYGTDFDPNSPTGGW